MDASTGDTSGSAASSSSSKKKMKKVLVAVDESDGSLYALQWTLENLLIKQRRRRQEEEDPTTTTMVTIVHVQPLFQPYVYPAGPVVYPTSSVIEAVNKSQDENAAALLSRALHLCKQSMVRAETLILKGDPKEAICQSADELHVDLLVVGSRGLSSLKRAFLGSVSDYCAHHAPCPVLIVKPPKETHK